DSNMHVNISSIGSVTNREILNNFVYGKYAHQNPKKKATLDKWCKFIIPELFLKYEFICILIAISDIVPHIKKMNKEVLEYLT
ncbi:unnamed protein product, partial [marine sediment metagenome]